PRKQRPTLFPYTTLFRSIPKYEQERIDTVKERIKKGLEEIAQGDYDANRLEQELIYYIEKFDVSEEKMRLANHLDYFLQTMKTPDRKSTRLNSSHVKISY